MKANIKKVALAYSGGLDTSVIIPWLKENYGCEVVAVAVDVGQADETSGLAEKAYRTGACDFHLIDAKEEFAKDYIFPVLKAGAIYEKDYLLGTATARPLIARKQVEIALATGCDALAHGCTGKGNDQVRFELAYQALAPELKVIARRHAARHGAEGPRVAHARPRVVPREGAHRHALRGARLLRAMVLAAEGSVRRLRRQDRRERHRRRHAQALQRQRAGGGAHLAVLDVLRGAGQLQHDRLRRARRGGLHPAVRTPDAR